MTRRLKECYRHGIYFQRSSRHGWVLAWMGGRGLGKDFAENLFLGLKTIFREFGKEQITKSSHLEKLCLISPLVGRDKISDFTTNFAKKYY